MEHKHPEYQLPDDSHARHRYESAMRHVALAKAAGKSSEELHAIFHKIMSFDLKNSNDIPNDPAHQKYRMAVMEAQQALAEGKTADEAHRLYAKSMAEK